LTTRPARIRALTVLAAMLAALALTAPSLLPANATTSSSVVSSAAAAKPKITAQPKSLTAYTTKTATFTVKATGATGYAWQTLKAKKWTAIAKATKASYAVKVATKLNASSYRVIVANKAGTVTSKTATLAVKPWPGTGTDADPYIVNHTFTSGNWTFKLAASDTNAWPEIKAAKLGGKAPAKGYSFVMTSMTITKTGKVAQAPNEYTIEAISTDDDIYGPDFNDNVCGKIPHDLLAMPGKLKPGQTRTGNVCVAVKTNELSSALWVVIGATDNEDIGTAAAIKLS
jgi:hypothetical protein